MSGDRFISARCAVRCDHSKYCYTIGGAHRVYKCMNKKADHYGHYLSIEHKICVMCERRKHDSSAGK